MIDSNFKTITDADAKKLSNIVLTQGWNAAFNEMMQMAKPVENSFDKWLSDNNIDLDNVCKLICTHNELENENENDYRLFDIRNKIYNNSNEDYDNIVTTMLSFNYCSLFTKLNKTFDTKSEYVKQSFKALYKAIEEFKNDDTTTFYRIDGFFALIYKIDDSYELKLVYVIEESTSDW